MHLAHQVRERRLRVDRPVVEQGLLAEAEGSVRLIEFLRNLLDEVVLLGDWNGGRPRQALISLILHVHLPSEQRASQCEESDKNSLTHPHVVSSVHVFDLGHNIVTDPVQINVGGHDGVLRLFWQLNSREDNGFSQSASKVRVESNEGRVESIASALHRDVLDTQLALAEVSGPKSARLRLPHAHGLVAIVGGSIDVEGGDGLPRKLTHLEDSVSAKFVDLRLQPTLRVGLVGTFHVDFAIVLGVDLSAESTGHIVEPVIHRVGVVRGGSSKHLHSATLRLERHLLVELEEGEAEFANLRPVLVGVRSRGESAYRVHLFLNLQADPFQSSLNVIHATELVQVL